MTETAIETTLPPEYEGWAIVELMGHRTRAGRMSEVQIAGVGFVKLETPAVDDDPQRPEASVEYYRPTAVYCLTPSTEDEVRAWHSDRIPF